MMTSQTRINIKNKVQAKAVKLSKKHRFLALEWSTGVGKTLGALKIVREIIRDNPSATGYLVCKESTHRKNWRDDIAKHRMEVVENASEMLLYASLHKCTKKADFVILDECHGLTPKRISKLVKVFNKKTKVILLSATIPKDKRKLINETFRNRVHYDKIPLVKAIDLGLLPPPKVIVHKLKLRQDMGKNKWKLVMRKPKKIKKKLQPIHECHFKDYFKLIKTIPKTHGVTCYGSEQEYYDKISSQMDYYYNLSRDTENVPYLAREGCRNKWLNLALTRKKFIAEVKTSVVGWLVKGFRKDNSRFICFTGTIKQANSLGGSSAVHSKNSNKENQDIIDCFNRGECTELFAVNMLREGVNLTNIEVGTITQLDSGVGSFFQMLGRCLRYEYPEMHLVILEGTQDEVYFKKAMSDFDEKYVTWR